MLFNPFGHALKPHLVSPAFYSITSPLIDGARVETKGYKECMVKNSKPNKHFFKYIFFKKNFREAVGLLDNTNRKA